MKAKILALSVIGSIAIFFSVNLAGEEIDKSISKKAHLSQLQTTSESAQQLVVSDEES
ncbi:hypothetical protein [Pantoea sp. ICBG 985]|uniref:hypothetical protein n=1 Tax=Pantoea sp. ICBG 985 TaxID=2071683 RepID=UPI001304CA55|nr:hypothetical protein [Pantoea sp. ICBG 985]